MTETFALAASFGVAEVDGKVEDTKSPTYQYLVGDLRTGRIVTTIPVTGLSWTRPVGIKQVSTFQQATLNLKDPDVAKLNPRLTCAAARTFFAIEYGDQIVAAYVIWSHDYSTATKRLVLAGAGLESVFDHRKVMPVLAAGVNPAKTTTAWSGLSLQTIAKRLVQLAMTHTGGTLPIVLPADVAGGSSRTYPGYELSWVGDALRQVSAVENGPDITFSARRRADDANYIEFVMETGTTAQPELRQVGANHVWDDTVQESPVIDVECDTDGSKLGMRGWVAGNGMDEDKLIRYADDMALVAAGYPLLEVEDLTHDTVEVEATLLAHAREAVRLARRPIESWRVQVYADRDPKLGSYRPGDYANVVLRGDPYLPDGSHEVRIVQIDGGASNKVTLTMEPLEGTV